MQEKKNVIEKQHLVVMENRKKITMDGIVDVYTFNDNDAVIGTIKGVLYLKGKNFHLDKFNAETNDLHMTGEVDSMIYKGTREKKGKAFLNWLLK